MEYKLIPSSTEIIINKAAGPADGNHAELCAWWVGWYKDLFFSFYATSRGDGA